MSVRSMRRLLCELPAFVTLMGFIPATIACARHEAPAEAAAAAVADVTPVPAPSAPTAQPAAAPAPLATADGSQGGVRAEVTELKRGSGGTVTLKFTLVNDSEAVVGVGDYTGPGKLVDANGDYTIGGVQLIDPVGKKKYFAARDSQGKCVCSAFTGPRPGGRANHWAKFAAPPDDVERISVVIPGFSPMDDVPLSR